MQTVGQQLIISAIPVLPALVFFAFFPFVDMIVAAKLLIVLVWPLAR